MYLVFIEKNGEQLKSDFRFNSLWAAKIKLNDWMFALMSSYGYIIDAETGELIQEINK